MISKENFLNSLKQEILLQLGSLQKELVSLDLEIANETKSSAGDKFETGREMMNQSREKLSKGIGLIKEQLWQIENFQKQGESTEVEMGSLIATNQGLFFFGLPLGKIDLDGISVLALSLNAPLGRELMGKKAGDSILFRDQEYLINYCQ